MSKQEKVIITDATGAETETEITIPTTWEETLAAMGTTYSRMRRIEFQMSYLRSPEDTILTHEMQPGAMERYLDRHFKHLVDVVAKETGADPAQIADKDKRTDEQQQALLLTSAREQLARMDRFLASNWVQALKALDGVKIESAGDIQTQRIIEPMHIDGGDTYSVPELTVLYFFAKRPHIRPFDKAALTDADIADLKDYCGSIDRFFVAHKGDDNAAILIRFIEQELKEIEETQPPDADIQIERLQAIVPTDHVIANHKLVNGLTRAPEAITEIIMEVSKKGAKNKVTSSCLLIYEGDNITYRGRQPFTEFDRNVYNAIVSLYVAGNRDVTGAMIWRTANGKSDNEKPTSGQLASITRSIDKMRFIRAVIDCGDEFKMHRITDADGNPVTGGFDDNLLHMRRVWLNTGKGGKQRVSAYRIIAVPVLYEYSRAFNQVLTIPQSLLDVKKLDANGRPTTHSLAYTDQRFLVRGYLLRRIEGMKGDNGLNNRHIAFMDYERDGQTHAGLYTRAGKPELSQPAPANLTDAEKTKRKDDARYIRADASAMLDYWTATGYIAGYAEYKDPKQRNAIAGYEIALTAEQAAALKGSKGKGKQTGTRKPSGTKK